MYKFLMYCLNTSLIVRKAKTVIALSLTLEWSLNAYKAIESNWVPLMRSYTIMSSPSLLEYHLISRGPLKWTTLQAFTHFTLSFPCAPLYADYSKFFLVSFSLFKDSLHYANELSLLLVFSISQAVVWHCFSYICRARFGGFSSWNQLHFSM